MKFLNSSESFSNFYVKKYNFIGKNNKIVSSVYIDRKDKDIICLSCMFGCPVKCKFCKSGQSYFGNLEYNDIIYMINYIYNDKKLSENKKIIFSFMGSGEPLLNYKNVYKTINYINKEYKNISISLSISGANMNKFRSFVSNLETYPKIQFSLHSAYNDERKEIIPLTDNLDYILNELYYYKMLSDKEIELNYILLNNINDSSSHINVLIDILKKYLFKLKINEYHDVNLGINESANKDKFIVLLNENNIFPEIYSTDGVDIGAACGQL